MEEYTQITLDQWTQWKEDIRRKLSETASNFVYIGYRLKQIRDSGMYNGAADVFEFAQKEYKLGKSTVSRFIAINEKYSEGGNSLELKAEFRSFSSSKLAEMLTLPDSEIQMITEKTTIREIRELKAFNSQIPEEAAGAGEVIEAAGKPQAPQWSPLEKCLIDFFKGRKAMLNDVMKLLEAEKPEYKQAAELMAPSGQASHKKGIVFLFMYDWDRGIKYKLMTEAEPVSMDWPEFLNTVYHIFGTCDQADIWKDFYGELEENEKQKEEKQKTEEKEDVKNVPQNESIQGKEDSVATSQQVDKSKEKAEPTTEIPGQQETVEKLEKEQEMEEGEQEAAGGENEESRDDKTQGETCADGGQTAEPSVDPESADEEDGTVGGAGEDSTGGGKDGESGAGDQEAKPEQETASEAADINPETTSQGAAGVDFTNADGFVRHVEKEKANIRERLLGMESLCGSGDWDGLIEEAGYVITLAESIKNMEEVFHG